MMFLVDMSGLLHSYFHVRKIGDIYDVKERTLHRMEKLRDRFSRDDCRFVAVFDSLSRKTFRHELFPQYKQGRTKHEDLPELEAATLLALSHDDDWLTLQAPELMEADDVIATICATYEGRCIVHSEDRDLHSCLDEGRVTILKKSNTRTPGGEMDLEYMNEHLLVQEYGFMAHSWSDYQTLVGGKDSIPGWDGVGPKTATELILNCVELDSVDFGAIKLNKRQQATYGEFQRMLPAIREARTLRIDLDLSKTDLFGDER